MLDAMAFVSIVIHRVVHLSIKKMSMAILQCPYQFHESAVSLSWKTKGILVDT